MKEMMSFMATNNYPRVPQIDTKTNTDKETVYFNNSGFSDEKLLELKRQGFLALLKLIKGIYKIKNCTTNFPNTVNPRIQFIIDSSEKGNEDEIKRRFEGGLCLLDDEFTCNVEINFKYEEIQ